VKPLLRRGRWPGLALALALGGCAHQQTCSLALPANWDDALLESSSERARPRTTLAVLPFAVSDKVKEDTGLVIGPMLTTSLQKTGRFELVEHERLQELWREQEQQQLAVFDQTKVAELGRVVGAKAVLFGEVSSATQQQSDKFAYDLLETEIRIDVRATDTTSGRILFAETAVGRSQAKIVTDAHGTVISGLLDTRAEFARAAAEATDGLGRQLSKQFPLMGFVLARDSSGIVTDLGSAQGLLAGDDLVVIRPSDRLVHPITKQYVGWKKAILGIARIQAVERVTSSATPLRCGQAKEALQPGDIVVWRPRN
jgi:hypothetical protein